MCFDATELSALGVDGLREVAADMELDMDFYMEVYPLEDQISLAVFVQYQLLRLGIRPADKLIEEMNHAVLRNCSELTHGE